MTQDLSNLLNREQEIAAVHKEGPLLVLAGAGSGKTRVVTYRILHLIESGIDPSQILAVTFTNKAAGEMQERIARLMRSSPFMRSPSICTFHSLGVRLLRESIDKLGYSRDFTIYDDEDTNKMLRGCLHTLSVKKEEAQIKTIKNFISHCKNQIVDAATLELPDAQTQKLFPEIHSLYLQRMKEANALDFDDLLALTVRLLQEDQEFRKKIQNRWHYLLIDEYQDTNKAQYLMARYIVEKSQNIFVVGDPDQSIYSWRGANIHNILNFERDYPGAKIIRLEQNYRSRANILDAANALISQNANRFKKELWSDRGPGEKISLYVAQNEREEAAYVVEELLELQRELNLPRKEMTIFYRTNFQSRVFEDVLLRMRIPYVIVGGISFYHRKEIKDVLAFLHMVLSDTDVVSFARTINLPKRGIGETTIEKICHGSVRGERSLMEYTLQLANEEAKDPAMRLSAKQKEGLKDYVALITKLREVAKEDSLPKLLLAAIRESGYLNVLREEKETYDDRKANLDELVSKAAEWELLNDNASLSGFLEELSLKSSLDQADMDDDKVNLMTIHNGKGLEFAAAFIVGMEEDLFPHANARGNYEAVEEERRLCYVGMTRAKERLYLTAAESRFLWGSYRKMRPSRFLREIPKEYIQRIR